MSTQSPTSPASKKDRPRKPRVWRSIERFTDQLSSEHEDEEEPPRHLDDTPRRTLRQPIWSTLRRTGPMSAQKLRAVVLRDEGLDDRSARIVNYHALALRDLQRAGYIEAWSRSESTKNGRTRKFKVYEAIKPRIRVKVGRGPTKPNAGEQRPPLSGTLRDAILSALLPAYRTTTVLMERMDAAVESRDVLKELHVLKAEGLVMQSTANSHWKLTTKEDEA